MKVNIYGVGRSGTKAIQLWVAYYLAKQYGVVRINYEPLQYRSRKLGPTHWGYRLHRNTPLLVSNHSELSQGFERFCTKLVVGEVVITKFIRANGRINPIDEITQPDLSVLVIRDLYQVLASIAMQTWSLVDDQREWDRLCLQAAENFPFLEADNLLHPTTNKMMINAIYWFVMNQFALDHLKNTLILDYGDLTKIERFAESIGLQGLDIPVTDPLFRGGAIHRDYPLAEVNPDGLGQSFPTNLLKRFVPRQLRAEMSARFIEDDIGSLCRINPTKPVSKSETANRKSQTRLKIQVEKNDLFDELSNRVRASMDAAIEQQNQRFTA